MEGILGRGKSGPQIMHWFSQLILTPSRWSNYGGITQCVQCSHETAHSLPVCLQKVNQAPTACKKCYYFTILALDSGYGMDLVSYPSEKSQTLTTSDTGWRVPLSPKGSPLPFPREISTSGKLMAYSRGQHTIARGPNLAHHLVIYSLKAKNGFYTFKWLEKNFFISYFVTHENYIKIKFQWPYRVNPHYLQIPHLRIRLLAKIYL